MPQKSILEFWGNWKHPEISNPSISDAMFFGKMICYCMPDLQVCTMSSGTPCIYTLPILNHQIICISSTVLIFLAAIHK